MKRGGKERMAGREGRIFIEGVFFLNLPVYFISVLFSLSPRKKKKEKKSAIRPFLGGKWEYESEMDVWLDGWVGRVG